MKSFGEEVSYSILKQSENKNSAYISFDIARQEAENLVKFSGCNYLIYKLVAIVSPKPIETVTKILPEGLSTDRK